MRRQELAAAGRALPDAVVFDMDGVLFDSEPLHLLALNHVLAEDGISVSEETNRHLLGWPVEDVLSELFSRHGLARGLDTYMGRYDGEIVRVFKESLVPAPGAADLLALLSSRGIRLGLASSSRHRWIEAALDAVRLRRFFEVVVSAEDVEHGKPQPDVYLLAVARLGTQPARTAAVEDSPAGVLAAKRAGLCVVAVRTPYTEGLVLEGADVELESLAEVSLADFAAALAAAGARTTRPDASQQGTPPQDPSRLPR